MAINHAQSAPDLADEELILKVAKGDKESFRILADRYVDMLYALARRMSPSETHAEDVVQEALLRIWEKASLWKPEGGASVKTWAYRVTYNLIIDVFFKKNTPFSLFMSRYITKRHLPYNLDFKIVNPNAKTTCGCGSSFSV